MFFGPAAEFAVVLKAVDEFGSRFNASGPDYGSQSIVTSWMMEIPGQPRVPDRLV